ncbi:methyltransferase [candidate division KSB1 bacterium]|nr:methyltransferase [candidate division KSB1 bacterium]
MTSRERVLTALNHQAPDRIPIDFSGHRSSGITAIAYRKLREFLGLPAKPIRVYDLIQQLAIVDEDVLNRFGVDTLELGRGFALTATDWTAWELPDGTPCLVPAWSVPQREAGRWILRAKNGRVIGQLPDGVLFFEQTYYPFTDGPEDLSALSAAFDECMWSAIAAPPGPIADSALRTGALNLRAQTDRAMIGLFGGNLLELGQFLYRNDNFFMLLAASPQRAHAFLDQLVALHLKNLEHYLSLVGEVLDVILFGDDLGMQSGPQISPAMYREFFKPRHQLLWQRAKSLAPVKVMLHCCGGVYDLLPDLIDAGLDAINPVQISAVGMDPVRLKREFGSDLTFWGGGCDTQWILPTATPQQVAAHVRQQAKIFKPNGGFVFQQVHNIMANVPPENIVAMFDAVNSRV